MVQNAFPTIQEGAAMKLGLPLTILVAAIAWIVLFVIIGIPIWIAFIVAAGIIVLGVAGSGATHRTSH
jgi:phosphate/sulfate permease